MKVAVYQFQKSKCILLETKMTLPTEAMAGVPVQAGVLPSFAGAWWGGGEEKDKFLMCWRVERSILPDLVAVAQLDVFDNSSCWYTVNVHKTLSTAGSNSLVDACCLLVPTTAG